MPAPGFDVSAYERQPELALASLLTMMSSFPARQSAAIAESILGHLCLVADDERQPPPVRHCAARLIETWSNYVELSQAEGGGGQVH